MSNPFDFFDIIFYINLDSRQDRNKQTPERNSRIGKHPGSQSADHEKQDQDLTFEMCL